MEKPKILLVDDKEANLVALETLLKDLDVTFIRAFSGNEALSKLLEHEFALLLIDVQMPDMDGFETVSLLRNDPNYKCLPIIFISAIYSEDFYKIKGIEAGAVDFIAKPIIPEILKGKVSVFLTLYNQRRELEEALDNIKVLSGLIPICANCKKIRDDSGFWNHLEAYIEEHSDASFSHGICPECAQVLYGGLYERPQTEKEKKEDK